MNPYQVLGISENATDEEVRAAYIKLAKEYHPDKYQDNPLKDLAVKKLSEIDEAYTMIRKERSSSALSNAGYFAEYSAKMTEPDKASEPGEVPECTQFSEYTGEYADQFKNVRSLLKKYDLDGAKAALKSIPTHNAEWHYLYGIVLIRTKRFFDAKSHFGKAVKLEPANPEYRKAFNDLTGRGERTAAARKAKRSECTDGKRSGDGFCSSFCEECLCGNAGSNGCCVEATEMFCCRS